MEYYGGALFDGDGYDCVQIGETLGCHNLQNRILVSWVRHSDFDIVYLTIDKLVNGTTKQLFHVIEHFIANSIFIVMVEGARQIFTLLKRVDDVQLLLLQRARGRMTIGYSPLFRLRQYNYWLPT